MSKHFWPVILILAGVHPLPAQTSVVSASFQQGSRGAGVPNGSTVVITGTTIGHSVTATLRLTYTGSARLNFPSPPQLTGSSDFLLVGAELKSLGPLESIPFTIQFTPTSSKPAFAQFAIGYQEMGGGTPTNGVFAINLTGTVPQVVASYTVGNNSNATPLSNGDTIQFGQSLLNGQTDATVTLSNIGSGPVQINSIKVSGAAFQVLGLPLFPATLAAGEQLRFIVRYQPKAVESSTGSLQISMDIGDFTVGLSGTALRSIFSYTLLRDQGETPLTPGQTIDLGDVKVGDRASVILRFRNVFSQPISLNTVGISGDGMSLSEGPILPLTMQPQDQSSFRINFAPTRAGVVTGSLAVGPDSFTVTGRAIGPQLQFTYQVGDITTPLVGGDVISFPTTPIGQTSTAQITIKNTGTGPAPFFSIGVTDPSGAFRLVNPPSLPTQVEPDQSVSFGVAFSPQLRGKATATLDLNGSSIPLAGFGSSDLNGTLQIAYRIGDVSFSLGAGGAMSFPPTTVTQTTTAQVTVTNTGTTPASIIEIGVTDPQNVFRLSSIPTLPTQIAPNQSLSFSMDFRPKTIGTATGVLNIDSTQINLSGSALGPPSLPAFQFSGASGQQQPLQQPSIGLALQTAYPLDVQGTLSLAAISDTFAIDPAVRFSTGGRSVVFMIPANQLQARFPGGATQIQLQTGSVAGAILISPTFQTTSGLDLTPSNAPGMRLDIPKLAPVLLSGRISSQTNTAFAVSVTGYATTRSVQSLDFVFTGANNQTLGHSTVDVSATSRLWFQSPTSEPFGSLFTIDMPFTLRTSSSSTTDNLVAQIRAIAVKATNEQGTSNTIQVLVP